MQIVIDISEGIMDYIKNNGCLSVVYNDEVAKAIKNGTPLPKGHGRLIDADMLKEYARVVEDTYLGILHTVDVKDIDIAPTIIDADKENDNERTV